MKKTVTWILAVVLFACAIGGAAILYNNLSEPYKGDGLNTDFDDFTGNPSDSESTSASTGSTFDSQSATENTESETTGSAKPSDSEDKRTKAPDFTVLDENGNEVRLSDFRGKPVVLNFWATWCYYCKVEMPDFNQAYAKHPEVQFLMVNATDGVQETVEGVKKFIAEAGYDFDVFFDTEYSAINAYHITGFPATFFIDAQGNLIARASGMIDAATLERGIAMLGQAEK